MNAIHRGIAVASFGIVMTGVVVSAPSWVNKNTLLMSPLSYTVHHFALQCLNENTANKVQLLHYFAKPIDRIIQAVVAPIFLELEGFVGIYVSYYKKEYLWVTLNVVFSLFWIPAKLIYGLFQSTLLLTNGALQLVVPYQTVYAYNKGKEASREFYNHRSYLINQMAKFPRKATYTSSGKDIHVYNFDQNGPSDYRSINMSIFSEPKAVANPTATIEALWRNVKISNEYDPLLGLDVRRAGGDGAESLWILYHQLKTGLYRPILRGAMVG